MKYLLIIVIILLFLVLVFRYSKSYFITNTKIELYDFWFINVEQSKNVCENIFNPLFKDINRKIRIYSVFGNTPLDRSDDAILVLFSVESYGRKLNSPSEFDINMSLENPDVVLPYITFVTYENPIIDINNLTQSRILSIDEKKFCLFAVSNVECEARNTFFHKLSEYKKVDSCGKHLNNMGPCPGKVESDPLYFKFISGYKFMICFENKSQKNNITEKLLNAYYGGAIPIYWGCPNIEEYGINMDAILYLKPEFTDDDVNNLIERIKYLDNNEEAYKRMYEQTFFVDGKIPDMFNLNKIREKVNKIILE